MTGAWQREHASPAVNRFAREGRITIGDVAQRAHVSKTTVSHVLSGNRPVALETRERVRQAISELGYRPFGAARSLRTKRSHLVALIIPDITNPYYPTLARGLELGLDGGGYHALICNTDRRADLELEFIEDVSARGVDGIVVDSFTLSIGELASSVGGDAPTVWIGREEEHPGVDTVRVDDLRGACDATMHLVERGHRRIAMIEGPAGAGTTRNEGYLEALRTAGIPRRGELMASGEWTREGGAMAMRQLMHTADPPTAVFCANDVMALGALDALRDAGLSTPHDVALVGFDDIEAAALVVPALSTVRNPAFEIGRVAGELLKERMTGAYRGPSRAVTLPCRLVVRASS